MRYPLWAFFFVLIMPPFAAHALITGNAQLLAPASDVASLSPEQAAPYWTHVVNAH